MDPSREEGDDHRNGDGVGLNGDERVSGGARYSGAIADEERLMADAAAGERRGGRVRTRRSERDMRGIVVGRTKVTVTCRDMSHDQNHLSNIDSE